MLIIGADGFSALSTQPFSVMTGFDRGDRVARIDGPEQIHLRDKL